jgi:hypothetical protein
MIIRGPEIGEVEGTRENAPDVDSGAPVISRTLDYTS